ncbi:gliding motility lipoprotein GldB [Flexibacter flexilis]|nr:hypothetical protein [Flexibacter flexilis]
MNKLFKNLMFVALIGAAASCGSHTDDECANDIDVSDVKVNAPIVRLDNEMFEYKKDAASFTKFMDKYPLFSEVFLQRKHTSEDEILCQHMVKLLNSPYLDTLHTETENYFGNLADVQSDLNKAFAHIKYYYPNFQEPKVYSMVSGFSTDVFVSDSMVVIGLDHFLREHTRYKPQMLPDYIQRRMVRSSIVPMIAMTTSNKYSAQSPDPADMLANMISWGQTYYFMKKVMPCTPDSVIIGYTGQEMKEVEENKAVIWKHFVNQKLFFTNDHFVTTKYIGERPHTFEIGEKCPGRIGRWLGWQIVKKYAEDRKLSLPEVMKLNNAKQVFEEAKYKP